MERMDRSKTNGRSLSSGAGGGERGGAGGGGSVGENRERSEKYD